MNRFWAAVAALVMVAAVYAWKDAWPPLPSIGIAAGLGYCLGYWTKR